jgi:hypothetical protein
MNQEQIEYYVEKYQMKMWGSTRRVAREWCEGIGSITHEEQREVLRRIRRIQGAVC